jgi:secondary thiamine-phosphate synthase enzyme
MPVETHRIQLSTQGNSQVCDLTDQVRRQLQAGRVRDGTATIFVVGSTAGITTTEFEPGLATHDLRRAFEQIAPQDAVYKHEQTWHDDNGHSHVRASVLGPSLTVPVVDGQLTLGTWQQIVLIDFDTRPRRRELILQVIGE